jgi:hypothetical protein
LVVFNTTLEKTRLIRERDIALSRQDYDLAKEYEESIKKLEEEEQRQISRDKATLELSERNRMLNLKENRQAELLARRQRSYKFFLYCLNTYIFIRNDKFSKYGKESIKRR